MPTYEAVVMPRPGAPWRLVGKPRLRLAEAITDARSAGRRRRAYAVAVRQYSAPEAPLAYLDVAPFRWSR